MKTAPVSLGPDNALLQSFIEVLTDPCVVIDSAGIVLAVNRLWKDLPRRDEVAAIARQPEGTDYLALFRSSTNHTNLERAIDGIRTILSGQQEEFEHEYIRSIPHTIRWFRMTVRAWQQQGASALIFHRDITAEKMGQAPSPFMDQEFRQLADSAPVMIWMTGPDKACTFVSRKWLEFTGARPEDALGEVNLHLVHPDDRVAVLDAFQTAYDQKSEYSHEYRLQHKDGGYRWVRDSGSPRFDAQHQFSGFTGSLWDVSDQKRTSEEADKAIRYARLAREVAIISNSAGSLRDALQRSVDAICETLGFPVGHALLIDDEEPDMAKSSHIVHVKDIERFKALFNISSHLTWPSTQGAPGEVLQTGKPVVHDVLETSKAPDLYPRAKVSLDAGLRTGLHFPVVVDDKVEAILEFGSEELLVSDGELVDCMITASERLSRFFERRRAQIRFLKQKEELQESAERLMAVAGRLVDSQEEERRRIAREIHDDFTQRLSMVSIKIGKLAGRDRTASPGEIDAGLEDIRKATAAVASDLRDLSHQLHPAMLELLGLDAALRLQCEEFQRTCGIETHYKATVSDEDATPQVATCLYRVLQESLMNISKHSGSAIAHVCLERNGDKLLLRIWDQGRGIESRAAGRRGVGLANVEERVRLLNGELIVKSEPGNGTEILVALPSVPAVS